MKHFIQVMIRSDGFADFRQSLNLYGLFLGLFVKPGVFNGSSNLVGNGHQQCLFTGGVPVRTTMLDINNANHFVLGDYRD